MTTGECISSFFSSSSWTFPTCFWTKRSMNLRNNQQIDWLWKLSLVAALLTTVIYFNFVFKSFELQSDKIRLASWQNLDGRTKVFSSVLLSERGRISSSDVMLLRFHTVYLHQCFTGHAAGLRGDCASFSLSVESSGIRRLRKGVWAEQEL